MEGTNQMTKKVVHSKESIEAADAIMKAFDPKTVADAQDAIKTVFGPIFEAMLKGELENHLGYSSNDKSPKDTDNRRNGSTSKTLKTTVGPVPINSPRDRDGTFAPEIVPKRVTDVSSIEGKVLAMYAKGMSRRDISDIIDDIYGFQLSAEQISKITDNVLEELGKWQARPLKKFYTFFFVDCIYVDIRHDYETVNCPVYVILAYDLSGKKDILGLWIHENESATEWLKIFDEIKSRGVEDVLFISMDGLTGLEEAAQSIFPDAVLKVMYLRILELYDKWKDRPLPYWTEVRNQLILIDKFADRIERYEKFEFPSLK